MRIYIYRNQQELGPYTEERLSEALRQNKFSVRDYARTDGMSEYRPLGEIVSAGGAFNRGTASSKVGAETKIQAVVPRGCLVGCATPVARANRAVGISRVPTAPRAEVAKKSRLPIVTGTMVIALAVAGIYVCYSPNAAYVRSYLASALVLFGKTPRYHPAPPPAPVPQIAVAPTAVDEPVDIPTAPEAPEPKVAPPAQEATTPFDPAKLAQNPAAWPKTVRLLRTAQFPAILNGRPVGAVEVPAGGAVKLVKIEGEHLTLAYLDGQTVLSWKLTNLEEAAAETAKLAVATMLAPSKPAVAAATPAAVGSWMWKHSGPNFESSDVDTSSAPEWFAVDRALQNSKYQLTPEVETAYLRFAKGMALRKITNSRFLLPADFLAWIDSNPIVAATVYGARKDAAGVLCMLRSLELDLGRDVVRRDYTQLALAMAVVESRNGATADLNSRPLLQLTIPGDPRRPVDTHAKDRPLDVNDHIINFLEDHAPIEGDNFGGRKGPLEFVKGPQGVPIIDEKKSSAGDRKTIKRPVLAVDVMESKALQEEFNAYMANHGQSVRIDCGDQLMSPNMHANIADPYSDGVKKATELFRVAYEAKGRLPKDRDAVSTPAERFAFLIRNDSHFPGGKDARKWARFPLKTAPWPTMTLLAEANDPLREREEIWQRFAATGSAVTYGEYVGGPANYWSMSRRLSPYPFSYGSFQMMMKDGGVCGVMAAMSVRTHTALGTPACTAGQPGHCALIVYAFDPESHSYNCHGEQYVTGGDGETTPHPNWAFGNADERRGMVWFQSVAWGVNAGFQSYLNSNVGLQIYHHLPKAAQKAHGLDLLQSGLAENRYNIALVEAAVENGDSKAGLNNLGAFLRKSLLDHGNTPGRPSKGLYCTAVEQLLEKHGATMQSDGNEVATVLSAR